MIKRIELINFMSHPHTVIEPAPGLTVLVGPNNCGKSAVVAALQILCYNDSSTYVMRHGERECSVKIETEDGHVIEWCRKNSARYVIDGQQFDRLGKRGVPDKLHQVLRLQRVEQSEIDIHFAQQKLPIFLLNEPPSQAAQFFASSSDAIQLVEMQKLHRKRIADAQSKKARLEKESTQLNGELEILEPLTDLDGQLEQVEQEHLELSQLAGRIEEGVNDVAVLKDQTAELAWHETAVRALAGLSAPPVITPTQPLVDLLAAMEKGQATWAAASDRADALTELTVPPLLAPTRPLETLARSLERTQKSFEKAHGTEAVLTSLSEPPKLGDIAALAQLRRAIVTLEIKVLQGAGELQALMPLQGPPQLADTDGLANLVIKLNAAHQGIVEDKLRHQLLGPLSIPPQLDDEVVLADLVSLLQATAKGAGHWQGVDTLLSSAAPAPRPRDITPFADLVGQMEAVAKVIRGHERQVRQTEADLAEADTDLREWARLSPTCPTCGGPIDPERLVAQTAAGGGGHNHG